MAKDSRFWKWAVPMMLIYLIGFAIASFFDLSINFFLYSPSNLYAILFEAFGWYPAFLPPILLALLWLTQPRSPGISMPLRLLCGLVATAGLVVLYWISFGYLSKRGLLLDGEDPAAWLWVATAVMSTVGTLLVALRFTPSTRAKLSFFCVVGCHFTLASQGIITALKLLWGRVRFDDMLALGSFELFTPWYLPFGAGGTSFPSAHTANAAGVFLLILLCDLFPIWGRRRRMVTVLCWGFVAAMAFSRVLIGRHFLSDTLAASLLMALLFYALSHSRFYRKHLCAIVDQHHIKTP